MENAEYTLEYFINKFESIPEEKWTTGTTGDSEGRHCAMGHCGAHTCSFDALIHNAEVKSLLLLTGQEKDTLPTITHVNDDTYPFRYGKTPKQRVINYLKSI